MDTYSHVLPALKRDAADTLDRVPERDWYVRQGRGSRRRWERDSSLQVLLLR